MDHFGSEVSEVVVRLSALPKDLLERLVQQLHPNLRRANLAYDFVSPVI
jgi:hypothetical protein